MKTTKSNVYFGCIFFLLATFITAQDLEKKTLTTSPFIGVKVFSGIKLKLIHSDVNKAVVFGPQSDDVTLSMRNEILQIKIPLGSIPDSNPTHIDLYHSRLLNEVSVSQGAQLLSQEPIRQTSLNLTSSTGGVIDLEVFTERLDIVANTGGRLELDGAVSYLNLKVNTGASCEAEKLQTEQVQAKLIGGGYAYVYVTELIDAQVLAGSVLRVYGEPVKKVYQKKLGGKIHFEE
ncbi:DUF2807 domain-containing protein [Flavobacteriaceae bacterium]|nr:DUF2807 domain-containing protein [Flavobacteriaceae bacterium]MDA9015990.1 DUF2807 domain-containing protein [Flavobacteriaceae bacterium]MDC3354236.1 DUF2807 domain-containing protein [Flavobacteriaceae bacterium]